MKDNIIVLCDTRLGKTNEDTFRKLWVERVFFNSYSSNKRGIAVLMKYFAFVNDLKWKKFIPNNFPKLSLVVKGVNVLIKCIYALNKDSIPDNLGNESTKFFNTIMENTDEEN